MTQPLVHRVELSALATIEIITAVGGRQVLVDQLRVDHVAGDARSTMVGANDQGSPFDLHLITEALPSRGRTGL
ncbi:MAG: hypothetical protein ACRDTB_07910 [Actinophytocola sp.]